MSGSNAKTASTVGANKIQIQPIKTQLPVSVKKDTEDLGTPSFFQKTKVPSSYVLVNKIAAPATRSDIDAKFSKWGTIVGVCFDRTRVVIKFDSVKAAKEAVKSEHNTFFLGGVIGVLFATVINSLKPRILNPGGMNPRPAIAQHMIPRTVVPRSMNLLANGPQFTGPHPINPTAKNLQLMNSMAKTPLLMNPTAKSPLLSNPLDKSPQLMNPPVKSPQLMNAMTQLMNPNPSGKRIQPTNSLAPSHKAESSQAKAPQAMKPLASTRRSISPPVKQFETRRPHNFKDRSYVGKDSTRERRRQTSRTPERRSRSSRTPERRSRSSRTPERRSRASRSPDRRYRERRSPYRRSRKQSSPDHQSRDRRSQSTDSRTPSPKHRVDQRSVSKEKSVMRDEDDAEELLKKLSESLSGAKSEKFHSYNWSDPRQSLEEIKSKTCQEETYDCLLIVLEGENTTCRLYSKVIDQRLNIIGMKVCVVFPATKAFLPKIIADVSMQCRLFAIIVTPQNQMHKSVTVNIQPYGHYGERLEHRNMPLEDAMLMIKRTYDSYTLGKPEEAMETQETPSRDATASSDTFALNSATTHENPQILKPENSHAVDKPSSPLPTVVSKPMPETNAFAAANPIPGMMYYESCAPQSSPPVTGFAKLPSANDQKLDSMFVKVGRGPKPLKLSAPAESSTVPPDTKRSNTNTFSIPGLSYESDPELEELYGPCDNDNIAANFSNLYSSAVAGTSGIGTVKKAHAVDNFFDSVPPKLMSSSSSSEAVRLSPTPTHVPSRDISAVKQPNIKATFPITDRIASQVDAAIQPKPKSLDTIIIPAIPSRPNIVGQVVVGRDAPTETMVVIFRQLIEGQSCSLRELDIVIGYLQRIRHQVVEEATAAAAKEATTTKIASNVSAWSSANNDFVRPARLLKEDSASPGPMCASQTSNEGAVHPASHTSEESVRPSRGNIDDFLRSSNRSSDDTKSPDIHSMTGALASQAILSSASAAVAAVLPPVIDNARILRALTSLTQNPNLLNSLGSSVAAPNLLKSHGDSVASPIPTPGSPTESNFLLSRSITPEMLMALESLSQHSNILRRLTSTSTTATSLSSVASAISEQIPRVRDLSPYDVGDNIPRREPSNVMLEAERRYLEDRRILMLRERQLYEKELQMEALLRHRVEYRNRKTTEERTRPMEQVDEQRDSYANQIGERTNFSNQVGEQQAIHMNQVGGQRSLNIDRVGEQLTGYMNQVGEQRNVQLDRLVDRLAGSMDRGVDQQAGYRDRVIGQRIAQIDQIAEQRTPRIDRIGEQRSGSFDHVGEKRSVAVDPVDHQRSAVFMDRDYRQPPAKNPRLNEVKTRDPRFQQHDDSERPRY